MRERCAHFIFSDVNRRGRAERFTVFIEVFEREQTGEVVTVQIGQRFCYGYGVAVVNLYRGAPDEFKTFFGDCELCVYGRRGKRVVRIVERGCCRVGICARMRAADRYREVYLFTRNIRVVRRGSLCRSVVYGVQARPYRRYRFGSYRKRFKGLRVGRELIVCACGKHRVRGICARVYRGDGFSVLFIEHVYADAFALENAFNVSRNTLNGAVVRFSYIAPADFDVAFFYIEVFVNNAF